MGFEYRYPLLYPKLLEFYLRLPLSQKRHEGLGRYLLRRYMAQHVPAFIFNQYEKKKGLAIIPATFELFKRQLASGMHDAAFQALPYPALVKHTDEHRQTVKKIHAYMFLPSIGIGQRG